MVYNVTNMSGSENFLQFAQNSGNVLGGNFFGYFVLIIVFFVVFLTLKGKGYTMGSAASVGSWMITITAFLLKAMNLIDNWVFWMCLIATPIAVFCIYFFGNPD